jgi:hypothetical protein
MQIASTAHSSIQKSAFDMAANIGSDFNSDTDEHMSYLSSGHQQLQKYLNSKYISKCEQGT